MSYINEIQHPTKSHFTGLLDVIYEDYEILQIFSIPHIIQKNFLLPYFQHIPFFQQILI